MQSSPPENVDATAHQHMWAAFTRFTVRGTVLVVAILLITGWITGVL